MLQFIPVSIPPVLRPGGDESQSPWYLIETGAYCTRTERGPRRVRV
jgi:hypothetical protein